MHPESCRVLLLWLCIAASTTFIMASAEIEMALTDFNGMAIDTDGLLCKVDSSYTSRWDAMAASVDAIEGSCSERGGILYRGAPEGENSEFMVGLIYGNSKNPSYSSITFAACADKGRFTVYESGTFRGSFGKVSWNDFIAIKLSSETPPKIEYSVNGALRYRSRVRVKFPLFMKISAFSSGILVEHLTWINASRGGGLAPSSNPSEAEECEIGTDERVQQLEHALMAATEERKYMQVEMIQLRDEIIQLKDEMKELHRQMH